MVRRLDTISVAKHKPSMERSNRTVPGQIPRGRREHIRDEARLSRVPEGRGAVERDAKRGDRRDVRADLRTQGVPGGSLRV